MCHHTCAHLLGLLESSLGDVGRPCLKQGKRNGKKECKKDEAKLLRLALGQDLPLLNLLSTGFGSGGQWV